ncbi:CYFA0S06e02575g1_1 [Cyberlindnera fabianii]|uniref:CYFA0S06e02575g1_1 n=1 Tax=Cyberlindnera fabianii TaxID=36022 RepID=A0A061AUA5_CYBFA|nr:CYFA0S06e02575g1_1 [Cyberlindnera fabianii]
MSTALNSQSPLTKRQRIEFEIFDKSIEDIERLFKTNIDNLLPKSKRQDTGKHNNKPRTASSSRPTSLFYRPPNCPSSPQTKKSTINKDALAASSNSNYTYTHCKSYTSLFSQEKCKTRETSVEKEPLAVKNQTTNLPKKKQKYTIPVVPRDDLVHTALTSTKGKRDTMIRKEMQRVHPTVVGVGEKNWNAWRSEVVSMIEFFANDVLSDSLQGQSDLGVRKSDVTFEKTVTDIMSRK